MHLSTTTLNRNISNFIVFCFVLYDLGLAKGSKRNISSYKLISTNDGNEYKTTAIAYHIFEESIRYNLG